MSSCNCKFTLMDRDLVPANRIDSTFWQMKYFEALHELQKANKGSARLRRRLDRLKTPRARKETPVDEVKP